MKITVAHPVWLSFWAICIYVLTITSVTYVIFRLHSMRREKKASDERTRFFINTAHDIRTPLTLIKAPLEEIQQKENLSEESQANMLTAMKNVDTLLRLTTNLINFSKAQMYTPPPSVYRNMNLIPIWKEYAMPFIVMQKPNRSNSTTKAT